MIAYKHLLTAKQKQQILGALQTENGVVIKPTKTQFEKFERFEKCIKIKYQYMVWHIINCGGDEIVNNLEYIQHVQTEEHQKLYKEKQEEKYSVSFS